MGSLEPYWRRRLPRGWHMAEGRHPLTGIPMVRLFYAPTPWERLVLAWQWWRRPR